jgi:hypothetical protein
MIKEGEIFVQIVDPAQTRAAGAVPPAASGGPPDSASATATAPAPDAARSSAH